MVADMLPAVAAQTGFTVESHVLELRGTCRDCRKQVRRCRKGLGRRSGEALQGREECSSGGGGRAI